MNTLIRTAEFSLWLTSVRDKVAFARIAQRLDAMVVGQFWRLPADRRGLSEMRIHVGAGYRVYFTRRGSVVYLLPNRGTKSSQQRDIKRAKQMQKLL